MTIPFLFLLYLFAPWQSAIAASEETPISRPAAVFGCPDRFSKLSHLPSEEETLVHFRDLLEKGEIEVVVHLDEIAAELPEEFHARFREGARAIMEAPDYHSQILRNMADEKYRLLPTNAKPGVSAFGLITPDNRSTALVVDAALGFLEKNGVPLSSEHIPVIGFRTSEEYNRWIFGLSGQNGHGVSFHLPKRPRNILVPLGVYLPDFIEGQTTPIGVEIKKGGRLLDKLLVQTVGAKGWVGINEADYLNKDPRIPTAILAHELVHFYDMKEGKKWVKANYSRAEKERLLAIARIKHIEDAEHYASLYSLGERRAYWAAVHSLRSNGFTKDGALQTMLGMMPESSINHPYLEALWNAEMPN